jgi:tripartite-type tricarboxylate transporter receptor subunit TctC
MPADVKHANHIHERGGKRLKPFTRTLFSLGAEGKMKIVEKYAKVSSMILLAVLAGFLLPTSGAYAASYPERPVTMLVGFPAGGPVDVTARTLIETVKGDFPKPMAVVNKPGGAATIATAELIRSAPDGYTLGMIFSGAVVASPYQTTLPYKGPGDLKPIVDTLITPVMFAVRADAPWKTMKEVIDFSKANPGKIRLGHTGFGSLAHLAFEDFTRKAQIDITQVPFEGAAGFIRALLGGHVDALLAAPGGLMGHYRAGKVKFLGTFEQERMPSLPETPTLKELGYDVIRGGTRYFVGAPKKTPANIIEILHRLFKKGVHAAAFQKYVHDNGYVADFTELEDLERELEKEYVYYGNVTKTVKNR